ncbi:MAG: hypothetical protein A2826_00195 [Candidatus Doudnabacteria bacterium RIFCSPHIGHO2_01_FULL_43_23]|uniref:GlcNAc-PI de-N-acetylase n=1 Tax=Candidatus Doudnabacteria bacterium RIFCSPHIGHO2_01_FULL_43_23 TaxID=1817822 RepID=A0A1F5NTR4_9BACT|nr:MAG: hypothetical protein A2826_00195 [Candidatus Doudnabacteria bacterium RIFCSPHIGHO2_01_FULL_43_23]
MSNNFLGKKILIVTSHPDDESFLCAGTIYKNFFAGGQTYLVCATLGEKGDSHLNRPATKKALKERRKKELLSAGRFLRISKIYTLNLPDGGLKGKFKIYYKKCLNIAKQIKPDVIFGFGPDGITGHHDHETSGKVAESLAKRLKIPFYAFSLPPRLIKSAEAFLNSKARTDIYLDKVLFKKPDIRVLIDPRVKMKAIRFHKSQLEDKKTFTGFSKFLSGYNLKSEYFKKR